MAADLMLSGVSKSGSPAPSPMTSRPAAFNSRAFWVTAMVGDGLMRSRREARNGMAEFPNGYDWQTVADLKVKRQQPQPRGRATAMQSPHCRDTSDIAGARSEERRVGKECRSRWSP